MSFSVRIPLRESFSVIKRLPTRFFTMVLAHSLRFVSGETWTKFRVIRSPTFIPVSIVYYYLLGYRVYIILLVFWSEKSGAIILIKVKL